MGRPRARRRSPITHELHPRARLANPDGSVVHRSVSAAVAVRCVEAVALELSVEGLAVDSEEPRGASLVAARFFQDRRDMARFQAVPRHERIVVSRTVTGPTDA